MDVTFNDQLWQAAAAGKTDGSDSLALFSTQA
jgi:hypothetical protein